MSVTHWLCAVGALTLFAACPAPALAATPFADCMDEFWAGKPPVLAAEGIADALCSSHFATLYSEQTETPLYSAEHLTLGQIRAAIHLRRDGEFRAARHRLSELGVAHQLRSNSIYPGDEGTRARSEVTA